MKQTEILFSFRINHETEAELDRILEKLMDGLVMATENKVECVYGERNKTRVMSFVQQVSIPRVLSMEELLEESR